MAFPTDILSAWNDTQMNINDQVDTVIGKIRYKVSEVTSEH